MPAKPEAQKLRDEVAKKFDERSIIMASDIPRRAPVSSGSLALDFAIGIGGLPSDKYIEFFGVEGGGKTTLGILAMTNFLDAQPGRAVVILDTEHKMSPDWLERLVGAKRMRRVLYFQPDDAEQAVAMYKEAVGSGQVSFVLFDSIAAAETRYAMEDPQKETRGGNAKVMGRFSRIAATFSSKYHCCTFAVNQLRDDMEGFHRLITPGGRAVKHHASLRVYIKRGKGEVFEDIYEEKVKVGYQVAAKIVKNQLGGIEGRTAQYWFFSVETPRWGFGVDQVEEIIRLGAVTRSIDKRGSWYHHPALPADAKGEHKVQGADQFAEFVKRDELVRSELTTTIMAHLKEHAHEVAPIMNPENAEMPVGELFRQDPFDA